MLGFSLPDSPEFDLWLTETQAHYEALFLKILAELVEEKAAKQENAAAIDYAQKYLAVDPLAEQIHRKLIEQYGALGDRAAARKQFETCLGLLERELGVSPLPETYAAYQASQGASVRTDAPITAWTVLPSLDLPLIGRRVSMDSLSTAFKRFNSGGMLLVSGEPGVGKTRLVQEFALRADGTIINANSHSSTQSLPYHPLVQALRQSLADQHSWKSIPEIWQSELTRLLPELRNQQPGLPHPLELEPGQSQARLHESLTRAFMCLAGRGALLLCLDDLHWADEATLNWLSTVPQRLANSRVIFIGTYRKEEADGLVEVRRAFQRAGLLAEVELGGLSRQAVGAILDQVSKQQRTHPNLASRLHRSTGGNAFFVLEILAKLLESKQLDSPPERLPLPETVQETIQTRLDRLPPLPRQILDAAAVLSQDLKPALLWKTAGRTDLETTQSLDALVRRQILKQEETGLSFRHVLLQESIYQALSPWRRQALHRRAGDALGEVYARRLEKVAGQRAQHYDAAGEYEQAVEAYEMAAQAAQAVYAHEEAIRHLRRAIALISKIKPEPIRFASLNEDLADSFAFLGRYMEAKKAYQSAFEYTPVSMTIDRANLKRKQAKSLVTQQKFNEAIELFRQIIASLKACQALDSEYWLHVWFETNLGLLNALYFQALPEEMTQVSAEIQRTLDQYGTPSQRFQFLGRLDQMQMRQSRYRPSTINLEHRRAILDHHLKSDNPVKKAEAHFGYAFMLLWSDDFSKAQHHFEKSLALSEQLAYGWLKLQCLTYLMILHRLRRRISLVQEMWPATYGIAIEVGFPMYIATSLANRAWLNYRKHEWEAAKSDARKALDHWGSSPYPLKWLAYWVLLAIACQENQVGEAIQASEGMLEPIQQYLSSEVMAALEEASERWKVQDVTAVRSQLRQAVKLAKEKGYL